jgi:hypothetical protein
LAPLASKKDFADLQEVMAEDVVGGEGEEFFALHHALLIERRADRIDHHRVGNVAMEGVLVAVLAA